MPPNEDKVTKEATIEERMLEAEFMISGLLVAIADLSAYIDNHDNGNSLPPAWKQALAQLRQKCSSLAELHRRQALAREALAKDLALARKDGRIN